MSLISIPAVYDGEHVCLLEKPPVHEAYSVFVTFVEPVKAVIARPSGARFWASFGAWLDDGATDATLDRIYAARNSRIEPPLL